MRLLIIPERRAINNTPRCCMPMVMSVKTGLWINFKGFNGCRWWSSVHYGAVGARCNAIRGCRAAFTVMWAHWRMAKHQVKGHLDCYITNQPSYLTTGAWEADLVSHPCCCCCCCCRRPQKDLGSSKKLPVCCLAD